MFRRILSGELPALRLIAVASVVGLVLIGLAAIDGSGVHRQFARRQLPWVGLGALAFLVVNRPHYRVIGRFSSVFFAMAVLLLVFILVGKYLHLGSFVPPIRGATRWIRIIPHSPLPPIQPSELAKLAYILALAAYLCHRTGANFCHYHYDYNSIVFYAKGAPLCTDFGNMYEPEQRREPEYHSRVSGIPGRGELVEVRSLSRTLGYSHGRAQEGNYDRHVLLVKSADPMGANYVLMRDETGGQPTQFNLWCLSKSPPTFEGSVARFTGQFGVDLDVHVLSLADPGFATAHWSWAHHIYVWGQFAESQHAVRVRSNQDYFTVLYPRAEGQGPADIGVLADGKAIAVKHCEGTDWIIFWPGQETSISQDGVSLRGEIAFARKGNDGSIRLAVLKGDSASARISGYALTSSGQSAVEVKGDVIRGEADGKAHSIALTVPDSIAPSQVLIDGEPVETFTGNRITLKLKDGYHTFNVGQADSVTP